jgi:hypothetical protein
MLQSRVTSRSEYIADLIAVIQSPETNFFVDTSFLLALGSLNDLARTEVTNWVAELDNRFRVPAWVVHELYGKVSKGHAALTPMATYAAELLNSLALVQKETRRFLSDERARGFNNDRVDLPRDRITFLSELDREVGSLLKRAQHLKSESSRNLESAAEALVALVESRVVSSDIYADLRDVQAIHAARLVGSAPPGGADKKKDENKYGDLIIWLEVVRACKGASAKNIVVLTNDAKTDWVYKPPKVRKDNGIIVNNDTLEGFAVVYPQPLLVHELRQALPGASLSLVNLATLAVLLHRRPGGAFPNLFAAYDAAPAPPNMPPELEGEAENASPPPLPEAPPAAPIPVVLVRDVTQALLGNDNQAIGGAIENLRALLNQDIDYEDLLALGRALAETVESGSEPAAVMVRSIVRGELAQRHAPGLVSGFYGATYFDAAGTVRQRPLASLIDDLFAAQGRPELADAVTRIAMRLAPYKSRFLLLPNTTNERVHVEIATAPRADSKPQVRALVRDARPLSLDMLPGAPGTVAEILGSDSATVEELRRLLAAHFHVPARFIDTNLTRSERVTFDNMLGLVPWGATTHFRLR